MNQRQSDVAVRIGVDTTTVENREAGTRRPTVRHYPAIADYLGYCPYEGANSLGKKIALHRTYLGLSKKDLARALEVDPGTISRWEADKGYVSKNALRRIRRFFDAGDTSS